MNYQQICINNCPVDALSALRGALLPCGIRINKLLKFYAKMENLRVSALVRKENSIWSTTRPCFYSNWCVLSAIWWHMHDMTYHSQNRLQLEYCEMIVSVEQAYALLLGQAASEKYNNYFVYSALTRAGYIVVKHRQAAHRDVPAPTLAAEASLRKTPVTSETCIWALLAEAVSHKPVPEHIKASPYYDLALSRMLVLKQQIINQSTPATDDNIANFIFDTRKRRAQSEPKEEEWSVPKRICPARTSQSLVDQLKEEPTYANFREIFQKLNIVQLARADHDNPSEPTLRSFNISFDLHLHNEGFRRSAPKTPYFSVIILPPDEPFPTHSEMVRCLQQQLPHGAAPLLVISVSESKQIQAFLYYIS